MCRVSVQARSNAFSAEKTTIFCIENLLFNAALSTKYNFIFFVSFLRIFISTANWINVYWKSIWYRCLFAILLPSQRNMFSNRRCYRVQWNDSLFLSQLQFANSETNTHVSLKAIITRKQKQFSNKFINTVGCFWTIQSENLTDHRQQSYNTVIIYRQIDNTNWAWYYTPRPPIAIVFTNCATAPITGNFLHEYTKKKKKKHE